MPEEKLQTLSLQVINGSELESGRAARCLFTQQGNVGHGPECHWSVQDRQQSIPAQAFTVILHDGTFCLRPQTAQLWLNQAKVTATSDLIQLRQGDEIQIGRLMVRVHLNRGDIPHYDEEMATPETIVTNRDMLTDTLLSTEGAPHYPGMTHRHQLADTVVNGFSADPLQALQSESLITTGDPLSGIAAVRPSAPLSDPASNGGINTPFIWQADIHDTELLQSATFVLAVAANVPVDQIQRQFIQQSKISSPEKIRNMVSVQIPGIPLRALMVAPRQLPYHSGFSYFELDKSGQAWTEMAAAGAVALHVSGSFPDLNMQLWAIRG